MLSNICLAMKKIIFIVISLMLCLICEGQVKVNRAGIEEMSVLEKSTFECIYSHIQYDVDIDDEDGFNEIFQLGRNYAQYMRYGTYRSDSVVQLMEKTKRDALTYAQYNKIQVVNGWNGSERILFDLKSQELTRLIYAGYLYHYIEPMPVQEWEFLPGETTVLGYKCRKARCNFRGREWTVWYSPEVRIPYGPWKLRGLPGMILMASDSRGAHSYEAIGIRATPSNMYCTRMYKRSRVVSRKECYRLLKEECFSFCKGMWEAYNEDPVNHPRPAIKRLPNVPHELDCE